jgi:hypothetical protein
MIMIERKGEIELKKKSDNWKEEGEWGINLEVESVWEIRDWEWKRVGVEALYSFSPLSLMHRHTGVKKG